MVDTMVVLLWIHVIEIFFTLDHSTQGRSQDCEVNGARIRPAKTRGLSRLLLLSSLLPKGYRTGGQMIGKNYTATTHTVTTLLILFLSNSEFHFPFQSRFLGFHYR